MNVSDEDIDDLDLPTVIEISEYITCEDACTQYESDLRTKNTNRKPVNYFIGRNATLR